MTSDRLFLALFSLALPGIAALLLVSCAGQVPPPGGPVDTVPPKVIRTSPDSNSVHVSTNSVEIEFSEYVDRRSVEESIFISPYVGDLEFDWSGREVRVLFSEPLKPKRTYVVNVGTDVIDVNARNRMATGFTLAFSTGDSIDTGMISGRVFDEKPEGIMIFAYVLEGIRADTLNPAHLRPDYIMQTGKGGKYRLSNIALGPYRLFAVRDEYRNLIYDKDIDQIGMASGDVLLAPGRGTVEGVNFVMTREDTSRPFVTGATAANRRLVDVRFSEPPDSSLFSRSTFEIRDTLNGREIPVAASFLRRSPVLTAGIVTGVPLDSGQTYRLRAAGVLDRAGNPLDSARATAVFEGTSRPDTFRTTVSFGGLRDSLRGVAADHVFVLEFSEPVSQAPLRGAIVLQDTLGKEVQTSLMWDDAAHARLVPGGLLASRTWYRLSIDLDSLRNFREVRSLDSTLVIHFQTVDARSMGTVEGTLQDADAPRAKHGYVISARSTNLTPVAERTVRLPQPGKFAIDRLLEGTYAIFVFDDRDSTGHYSHGSSFPFVPGARFAAYPDTVRVRARWAVEGVQIQLGRQE